MNLSISILMDESDVRSFSDYLTAVERRAARQEMVPILLSALQPLVASEQAFLGDHSKSGALVASLSARSGSGDRPGTISVFASPTAKVSVLRATWGKGRAQQRRWAARLPEKGKRAVFYGPIVHQGHRIVKRRASGELYDTGKRAAPVPFAAQAVEALGESAQEAAAAAVLNKIVNG